jgi:hypothetical protein
MMDFQQITYIKEDKKHAPLQVIHIKINFNIDLCNTTLVFYCLILLVYRFWYLPYLRYHSYKNSLTKVVPYSLLRDFPKEVASVFVD